MPASGDERDGPLDGRVAVPPGTLHREVLAGDLVEVDVLQRAAQGGRDDYPAPLTGDVERLVDGLLAARRRVDRQVDARRADDISHLLGQSVAGDERVMRAELLRYGEPGGVALQPADNDLPGASLPGGDHAC